MYEAIKEQLKDVEPNSIVLTIIPTKHYQDITFFLLRHWLKRNPKIKGTYVSLNRPYSNLTKILEKENIDEKRLYFIDCVTRNAKGTPNCSYIGGQRNLTKISIEISNSLKKKDISFAFFDSLNTLALFNGSDSATKFIHSFVESLRAHKKDGLILGIDEETDQIIIDGLCQVCDIIIDLTDETTFI